MPTPQPVTFGALLRRYRKAARLTQEALAARAGYSTVYIGMLERGERMALPATVDVLAGALELTATERLDLLNSASASVYQRTPRPPTPLPLVGRQRELAVLGRYLGKAGAGADGGSGRPPVLLMTGEPGIGKTRLLDEALVLAGRRGWHTLSSGCQRRGGEEAYAPIVAALEGHLRRQPSATLQAALAGAEWLVRMLPELAERASVSLPAAVGVVSPAQERRLIFQAVARFLANSAGPAGTLLVLDDLQWAGADALDLLTALVSTAEEAGERPIRVIGAYRSTELSPAGPLAAFLADLAREGLVTQVVLRPLTPEESAQLLDALLDPRALEDTGKGTGTEWREELVRRAAGVPFYLVSYVQGLSAGALSSDSSTSTVASEHGIPWTISQTIRQRLAALAPVAQATLQVVAVAGRTVERRLVVAATQQLGQTEHEIGGGLDDACRAGLLIEVGDDGYAFAHDLIREVVVSDMGAAQRARLHGLMAAVLAGDANPPESILAYHYARAGDQEHAIQYLGLAGDRALELRAYGEAEDNYRELVTRLERLGQGAEAAQARERLGEVLISAGHYGPAMEVLETAEEQYRVAGSVEGLGRVLVQLGQVYGLRGRAQEGLARLLPRVEQLERQGLSSSGQAALLVTLGHLFTASSRHAELLHASERAIELARDAGDKRLEDRAAMRRGIALAAVGRLDEAVEVFDTAARASGVTGDLWNLSIALGNQAAAYSRRGDLVMARQRIEQAREAAERFGGASMIVLRWCESSQIAFLLGDWQRAHKDVEHAMGMLQAMEESWTTAYALTCLGELAAAEGRLAEAAPLLERAIGFTERSGDLEVLRSAQRVAAELELLGGHPAVAYARLEPLRDRPSEHVADVTEFLYLLAWAQLDLGDEREATALANESVERARLAGMRRALADALRVRAQVAVHTCDWGTASGALAEALDLCCAIHAPYAEAKTRYGHGLLHVRRGESRAARAHFRAALAILNRLGEHPYAERVRSALSALEPVGVRTHGPSAPVQGAPTT